MRLDRLTADRTGASRKVASALVKRGCVRVDGVELRDPAVRVAPTAVLEVDGETFPPPIALALFHKPVGVHSTLDDSHGRASLATAAAELVHAGLHPVGRLDADTDGLLLFSRDGALTQHLLHPKRAVPRTYRARVEGTPGEDLGRVLAAGVATADGVFTARLSSVSGDEVVLEVTEGKHRMVRRMLANAGFPVVALRRLSFGPFVLGDLPPGSFRLPTDAERAALDWP